MDDLPTSSFAEIDKLSGDQIVLFGSGNIAKKTLRELDPGTVAFIADNSENLQGGMYQGHPIRDPGEITQDHFVIITSTAILDISEQLMAYDLVPMDDFVVSPVLNDRIAITELENIQTEFYFTSGAISGTDKFGKYGNNKYGGGLFKCTVDGLDYEYERIYEGPCYGSVSHNDRLLFIDTDTGLMEYDDGEITQLTELPSESRPHGISYNQSNNRYYVACSYRDSVLEFDESFEKIKEFNISDKIEYDGEAMHHCNDCLAIENSLFVTMFSSSGNWKRDSFDGCIAEFNIETGERLPDVRSDLQMPHNIDLFNGALHVLDSLPGELRFNNLSVQGSFPAFSRGLDYEDGLYYVGQSKNRNHSKVIGASKTVSIDCGVVIFEPELQISRFLHFPDVAGVHSITC
jgi:hypothetical protein